jgi:hypothetical protein
LGDFLTGGVEYDLKATIAISATKPKKARPDLTFKVIKKWDDGTIEYQNGGRKFRVVGRTCIQCERTLPDQEFRLCITQAQTFRTDICRFCVESYTSAAWERERILKKRQQRENAVEAARRRVAAVALASPAWRDRKRIAEVYEEAQRMTEETGIVYHVDHYYPIQGELCCGLHIHENLRILPAKENIVKSNSQPLENSPATMMFLNEYGQKGLDAWIEWARAGAKRFKRGRPSNHGKSPTIARGG